MSNLRYHRCVRCHSIPFMRFLVAEQLCPPATSQLTALAIIPTRASTAHARDASHNVHPDSLEEISEIACSESSVARSKPEFAAGGRSADETAAIDTVARVHCLECRAIAVRGRKGGGNLHRARSFVQHGRGRASAKRSSKMSARVQSASSAITSAGRLRSSKKSA